MAIKIAQGLTLGYFYYTILLLQPGFEVVLGLH